MSAAFRLAAFVIVVMPLAVSAAELELPKFKSISEWFAKSTKDDQKKCDDVKKAKNDIFVGADEMCLPYCWCLKKAKWAADDTKENFCRLHAILMGKAHGIGMKSKDQSDDVMKKNNAAVEDMQEEVRIRPPILSRELLFSSSSLKWNQDTKELVFECTGDVELGASSQTMRKLKPAEDRAKVMEVVPKAPSAFKYSAKIISETTKGMLSKKTTTVKVDPKTEQCSVQFQKAEFLFGEKLEQDPDLSNYAMKALGGEENVKQALIKSACDRFQKSVNFALDIKEGGAVKLLDLPSYNQP